MYNSMTTQEIYKLMVKDKRNKLIVHIRNNKTRMSITESKKQLEKYWPTGSLPTLLTAQALFNYLNEDAKV